MAVIKNYQEITNGYSQKFYYQPLHFGSASSAKILELCDKGTIGQLEVAIMRYLLKFRLAAFSQIERDFLSDKKAGEVEEEKTKLLNLVRDRVLNVFILTNEKVSENTRMPKEGEMFFTLDYGAITLLRSLLNDETLDDWKASDALMSDVKVKKACMMIDLYSRLKDEAILNFFNGKTLYSASKVRFSPKATFSARGKVFFVEALTEFDTFVGNDSYLFDKLAKFENFLNNEVAWKYFFEDQDEAPILIILCENEKTADIFSKRVNELNIPYVYYLCMREGEEIYKSFYMYKENSGLIPVEISLLTGGGADGRKPRKNPK